MGARRGGGERVNRRPPGSSYVKLFSLGGGGGVVFSLSYVGAFLLLFLYGGGIFWLAPPTKISAGAHALYEEKVPPLAPY